ncbi:MAG: DUF4381 family protein [Verrucomicrobiales bacterium]|nr:DUF4381 family protein [Verrucomicrobiota bacterium JB025]
MPLSPHPTRTGRDASPRRPLAALALFALSAPVLLAQQPAPAPEEDIRPPKPLIEIPEPEKAPVHLYLIIAGVILLAALAAWLIHRHLRKTNTLPPHETALASLATLESSAGPLTAESFANRAADTIRRYIAARFQIAAPTLTTEEFLRTVTRDKSTALNTESDHLKAFLHSCDLAKFAGTDLTADQRSKLLTTARSFINTTTPKPPKGRDDSPNRPPHSPSETSH